MRIESYLADLVTRTISGTDCFWAWAVSEKWGWSDRLNMQCFCDLNRAFASTTKRCAPSGWTEVPRYMTCWGDHGRTSASICHLLWYPCLVYKLPPTPHTHTHPRGRRVDQWFSIWGSFASQGGHLAIVLLKLNQELWVVLCLVDGDQGCCLSHYNVYREALTWKNYLVPNESFKIVVCEEENRGEYERVGTEKFREQFLTYFATM